MSLEAVRVKEEPETAGTDQVLEVYRKEEAEVTVSVVCVKQEPAGANEAGTGQGFQYEIPLEPDCLLLPGNTLDNSEGPSERLAGSGRADVADTNPYACDTCGEAFQHRHALSRHVQAHLRGHDRSELTRPDHLTLDDYDPNKKTYSCKICKKHFKRMGHLNVHQRIHTGARPFSCDICHMEFKSQSNLKRHILIHTGERPYSCDVCRKEFTQPGHLTVHKRSHTGERPYACDMCNKEFARSGVLAIHKRVHTGAKPFWCDICKKGFANPSYLKIHKRIHTGDTPFSCEVCNKKFTVLSNLKAHKQTHERVKSKPFVSLELLSKRDI